MTLKKYLQKEMEGENRSTYQDQQRFWTYFNAAFPSSPYGVQPVPSHVESAPDLQDQSVQFPDSVSATHIETDSPKFTPDRSQSSNMYIKQESIDQCESTDFSSEKSVNVLWMQFSICSELDGTLPSLQQAPPDSFPSNESENSSLVPAMPTDVHYSSSCIGESPERSPKPSLSKRRTHRSALEGDFHCTRCGRRFLAPSGYKQHVTAHHSIPRPHVCKICGKSFPALDELETHQQRHSNLIKPYECSVCFKRYQHLQSMLRHYETHHAEPRYRCSICGKGEVRNDRLLLHEHACRKASGGGERELKNGFCNVGPRKTFGCNDLPGTEQS